MSNHVVMYHIHGSKDEIATSIQNICQFVKVWNWYRIKKFKSEFKINSFSQNQLISTYIFLSL